MFYMQKTTIRNKTTGLVTLNVASVTDAPQCDKDESEKCSTQEVSESCQVWYGVTVRVFAPPPQTVDHAVSSTQQQEDLRTETRTLQLKSAEVPAP